MHYKMVNPQVLTLTFLFFFFLFAQTLLLWHCAKFYHPRFITYAIDAHLAYNLQPFIFGVEKEKVWVLAIFPLFVSQTLPACEIS